MFLFQKKQLAVMFSGRNVVLESHAVKNKRDEIILNLCMDFCSQGAIRVHRIIHVKGRKLQTVISDIEKYQDEALELINIFENYKEWLTSNSDDKFIKAIYAGKPFMFVGHKTDKQVRLEIYGHGLFNLSLQFDHKDFSNICYFIDRIDELVDWVREHLSEIDNLQLVSAFKGVLA